MIHVVLPWWNTPKMDDMPETGGRRLLMVPDSVAAAQRSCASQDGVMAPVADSPAVHRRL